MKYNLEFRCLYKILKKFYASLERNEISDKLFEVVIKFFKFIEFHIIRMQMAYSMHT